MVVWGGGERGCWGPGGGLSKLSACIQFATLLIYAAKGHQRLSTSKGCPFDGLQKACFIVLSMYHCQLTNVEARPLKLDKWKGFCRKARVSIKPLHKSLAVEYLLVVEASKVDMHHHLQKVI